MLVLRPSTASATTRTSMPLSTTVASASNSVPRFRTRLTPVGWNWLNPLWAASSRLNDRLPPAASASVISTGTTIAPNVTRAASPTIAFGLRLMVLNAPSKKSPRPSGRSATTPGL